MDIGQLDLAGKTVLEVGCGLGNTTGRLARMLASKAGSKLIVTDISDRAFAKVQQQVAATGIVPEFIKTDACELVGIAVESVDYVVCNYALCEINSRPGRGVLALQRFLTVLKSGGILFIEEEFPMNFAYSPPQNVWAVTWRLMKAVIMLVERRMPTAEYEPDVLATICEIVGFQQVDLEVTSRMDSLSWLSPRIEMLNQRLVALPNEQLRIGFVILMQQLRQCAENAGRIEIPIYRLVAKKPSSD